MRKMLEVEKILQEKEIEHRIIKLSTRAVSVKDVLEHSKENINLDDICKCLILKNGESFIAVLLRGKRRVDYSKLKRILGKKPYLASPKEVKKVSGVEPGAVCCLLLGIPMYMDPEVFEREKINMGSGNHLFGIEMNPNDLKKIIDFTIADIKVD